MSREREGYRENLQDVLEFFDGRRALDVNDVVRYTGINVRTVKKYFFGEQKYISASTLAFQLCRGGRP